MGDRRCIHQSRDRKCAIESTLVIPWNAPVRGVFAALTKQNADRIIAAFSPQIGAALIGINVAEYASEIGLPATNVFVFVAPKPPTQMIIADRITASRE